MIHVEINKLIAEAMKSKQKARLYVLKMMKAKFLEYQTSKGFNEADFTETREIAMLQKMKKEWEDELAAFKAAGRDNVELEEQIAELDKFIPQPPTREQVMAAIKESGIAPEMKNMRAILQHVQQRYMAVEGRMVNECIKELQQG